MRLYRSTAKIARQYIIKELTGKKICMRCALSISRKRIINSAIFSISHQDRFLKKSSGKTPQNRRVVNFFSKDYVRYSVNITVYRSQTDFFVSFSSGAI